MLERLPTSKDRLSSILSVYPSFLIVISFCVSSLFFSYLSYQSLVDSQVANEKHYEKELLIIQLQQKFDQLSLMANRYVLTGETKYFYFYTQLLGINNENTHPLSDYHLFWNVLISENPISPMPENMQKEVAQWVSSLALPEDEYALLLKAKEGLTQFFKIESQAFLEIEQQGSEHTSYEHSEHRQRAISLLFSDPYLLAQANIKNFINLFFELQQLRSYKKLQERESWHSVMSMLTLVCFLCLIFSLLYNFYKQSKHKALFAKTLKKEVSYRTFELFEKREELKMVINEMAQTKNQLVESEKMASLGSLVSGVAHEVNTPLGISVTLGSHLQDETMQLLANVKKGTLKRSDLDSFCAETIQSCTLLQANLERAANLISSFKQVAVDRSSDELRTFKMSEYIDEVILSLHPQLKKTSIEIVVDAPKDEPLMLSYPGDIAQIITNLVMNAIIHAFNKGVDKGKVIFTFSINQGEMLLKVHDNGKGMLPGTVEKIFDPFFTTERGNGGSGLGMHITYNLVVHSLGGRIKCQSELGEGTTFLIDIPMQVNQSI